MSTVLKNSHGFSCLNRDTRRNRKHKCNCKIGKLARSIYYKCYRSDFNLKMYQINELANTLINFYKNDTSSKHKEFFKFLETEIKQRFFR